MNEIIEKLLNVCPYCKNERKFAPFPEIGIEYCHECKKQYAIIRITVDYCVETKKIEGQENEK